MQARGRPGQLSLKPLLHCDRTYFPQIRWSDFIKNQRKLLIIGIFIRNVSRKGNWKPEPSTCLNLSYKYSPSHSQRWQTQGLQDSNGTKPRSLWTRSGCLSNQTRSVSEPVHRFSGFVTKRVQRDTDLSCPLPVSAVRFNAGQTPSPNVKNSQITHAHEYIVLRY